MLQFREISPSEYNLIKDSLRNSFNLNNFKVISASFKIFVSVGKWKEVLLISDQILKIFQEFKEFRNPYFMGIYFGDIKRNKFKISLEGITILSNFIEEKTVLNDSGEQKVLYGRDLTRQELKSHPESIQKNDLSILINERGEVLALGKYQCSGNQIKKSVLNQIIIKNVIDKGWYLRKGR